MVELLVALALFSFGMMGLLSAQLTGQRAIHAALQRSMASSLAADLMGRIEANAAYANRYVGQLAMTVEHLPVEPPVDCYRYPCTPQDLAAFDLWDWRRQAVFPGAGALPGVRACVVASTQSASVTVRWRLSTAAGEGPAINCDSSDRSPHRAIGEISFSAFTGSPE